MRNAGQIHSMRGLGMRESSIRSMYDTLGRPPFFYSHRLGAQFLKYGVATPFSTAAFPARTIWNEVTQRFESYAANDPGWGCVLNPELVQLNSDSLPDANWNIATYVTLSPGATTGPFPGTAVKMIETTENSVHYGERSAAVASGVFHQMTFVVKAAGRRYIRGEFVNSGLWGGSPTVTFDLVAGTHAIEFSSTTYGAIVPLADGWYACSLAKISTGAGSSGPRLRILNDSQASTYTGNGVDGIFVRSVFFGTTGGQFLPMLPLWSNDDATDSQAACSLGHVDAELFGQFKNEGTILHAFEVNEPSPAAQREWLALNYDDDSVANGIWHYATSGNYRATLIFNGTLSGSASEDDPGEYPSGLEGWGSTWKNGDKLKLFLEGGKQTAEGNLSKTVDDLDRIKFGGTYPGSLMRGSKHYAVAAWPYALPDDLMKHFSSPAFVEGLRLSA